MQELIAVEQRSPTGLKRFQLVCSEVAACARCDQMSHSRVLTTANGPLDAQVLFVAEAPGRRGAARTGIPLQGDESGDRFEVFLDLAGLRREHVFVTNAVLCNPTTAAAHNRTPRASEIAHCRRFLETTLEIVGAPLVVALGRVALTALARIDRHEMELRWNVGEPRPWHGRTLVALYHPSRQSTLHRGDEAQRDDWRTLRRLVSQL